ncbi:MAG: ATP phosphoribosyltransferase regulatory subunit [Pseudomonadota bacterium]|jgi:ATP phosphoribosyltransferase regulatory subunit
MGNSDRSLMLPAGVFELAPPGAALVRRIEDAALEVFRLWGYQEVRTPSLEYVETMSLGLTGEELDMAFKLVDRETGKMMLLRSDVTPQVARMASLALSEIPLPLRLCYVADVYRHPDDPSHPGRELIHAGVELLGIDDPQADAEVLAVGVQTMQAIGLRGITMSVGQVQYARGLFDDAGFDKTVEDLIVEAACRKDRSTMKTILDMTGASSGQKESILSLTELTGTPALLDRAHSTAPNLTSRAAVENLKDVITLSRSYGVDPAVVSVDLGELASFRYHTGTVFTGFAPGAGRAVLKGGRYDNLAGVYGRPSPATGFAIDLLEAARIVGGHEPPGKAIDYLLVNRSGTREKGLSASVKLRDRGRNVLCLIRDIPDRDLGAYSKAHGIRQVLILDEDGVSIFDTAENVKKSCDFEEL